jgi:hypothetical protein
VVEQNPTPIDALHELHEILLLAALDMAPQRLAATRYTSCREILLKSALRPALPGFLLQCLTLYRFRDFIHLYHPNLEPRIAFVDEALGRCVSRARERATDVLRDLGQR